MFLSESIAAIIQTFEEKNFQNSRICVEIRRKEILILQVRLLPLQKFHFSTIGRHFCSFYRSRFRSFWFPRRNLSQQISTLDYPFLSSSIESSYPASAGFQLFGSHIGLSCHRKTLIEQIALPCLRRFSNIRLPHWVITSCHRR